MHIWTINLQQRSKNTQWRKNSLFNKWCWRKWRVTCKNVKLDQYLTPYRKNNWKWFKDFNTRFETIKLLEENIGSTLFDISLSNVFLDMSPQTKETKAKINKWDYIKLKSFCIAKETINRTKRQPTEWKKIFENHISDKQLISKIHKEFIQTHQKQNKQPY